MFFLPTVPGVVRPFSFLLALVAGLLPLASSEAKEPSLDMFAAMETKELEATVVPRDSTRLTVQLKNLTDRPLAIRIPAAIAAAPVLAQFNFPGLPQQNNANDQAGQQLGAANNPLGQPFGQNPGIFNVPAGKVVKLRLPCVCLEHGKPTPNSRMAYELKPLSEVTDRPEVAAAIVALGRGEISRRVAQLAAWHYNNGKSWQELAALRDDHLGAFSQPKYSAAEIRAARQFAEKLDQQKAPPATATLSRVP